MIRIVLLCTGFLAITLALILIQPTAGLRDRNGVGDDMVVTRAQTDLNQPIVAPSTPAPAPRNTPLLSADTALPARAAQQTEHLATPAQTSQADATPLSDVQLASLVSDSATPQQTAQVPQLDSALEQLVVTAVRQGQSDAYIDALVNSAALNRQVDVPRELVTQDGRVDTQTLLSALSASAPPAEGPTAGYYIVKPGDSLSSIAYRFYGRTSAADTIFRANNAVLDINPVLVVGMRLKMPPS
ncbi:LysM domain-containing protein [Roseovarius aestuarii]|nr:LysM domain-containing protein [Roseovarius aestuarii]